MQFLKWNQCEDQRRRVDARFFSSAHSDERLRITLFQSNTQARKYKRTLECIIAVTKCQIQISGKDKIQIPLFDFLQ